MCPRFTSKRRPQKQEGARDPQERARGRPGARCTRGLMCTVHQNKTHMSIQVKRKHSGLPCAVALRLIRALPGESELLDTIAPERRWPPKGLDASNPGVRTTRLRRTQQRRSPARIKRATTLPRPPHPDPNVRDDSRDAPLVGQDGRIMQVIWNGVKLISEKQNP